MSSEKVALNALTKLPVITDVMYYHKKYPNIFFNEKENFLSKFLFLLFI